LPSGVRGQDRDASDKDTSDHAEKYRQQEWN
jgi:hypothetical protein